MTENSRAKKDVKLQTIPSLELAVFCQQLGVIVKSDIMISEGIGIMSEQVKDKRLKSSLVNIEEKMAKGETFSSALESQRGAFPDYMINMVNIGEASGTLDDTLAKLAKYYEKEHKVRRKVRTALTYPIILALLMVAVILLLLLKVLPMFANILESFGGAAGETGSMVAMSNNIMLTGLIVIAVIIVAVIVLVIFGKTAPGKLFFDRLKLQLPISRNLLSLIITSRFARSLSILLKSGIPAISAVDMMTSLLNNDHVEKQFNQCKDSIKQGQDLYTALGKMDVFPPLFMRMVLVGQRTGNVDEMLSGSADLFDEEVDNALEKLTTAIEPILIIILSVIVGAIMLTVMLPMIDIMNSIG